MVDETSNNEPVSKWISDILVDNIVKYVKKRSIIPEEFMDSFLTRAMYVVQEEETDQISSHYYVLSDMVSHYLRGYLFDDQDENSVDGFLDDRFFVYQMGQLHSCITMINDIILNKNRRKELSNNTDCFVKNIVFFESIAKKPGITHRELALCTGKSVSSLSQFIAKIRPFGFISQELYGREKKYYLTRTGSKLLNCQISSNNNKFIKKTNKIKLKPDHIILKSSYYDSDILSVVAREMHDNICKVVNERNSVGMIMATYINFSAIKEKIIVNGRYDYLEVFGSSMLNYNDRITTLIEDFSQKKQCI